MTALTTQTGDFTEGETHPMRVKLYFADSPLTKETKEVLSATPIDTIFDPVVVPGFHPHDLESTHTMVFQRPSSAAGPTASYLAKIFARYGSADNNTLSKSQLIWLSRKQMRMQMGDVVVFDGVPFILLAGGFAQLAPPPIIAPPEAEKKRKSLSAEKQGIKRKGTSPSVVKAPAQIPIKVKVKAKSKAKSGRSAGKLRGLPVQIEHLTGELVRRRHIYRFDVAKLTGELQDLWHVFEEKSDFWNAPSATGSDVSGVLPEDADCILIRGGGHVYATTAGEEDPAHEAALDFLRAVVAQHEEETTGIFNIPEEVQEEEEQAAEEKEEATKTQEEKEKEEKTEVEEHQKDEEEPEEEKGTISRPIRLPCAALYPIDRPETANSTGYRWEIYHSPSMELVSDTFVPNERRSPGAPGTRRFLLRKRPGSTEKEGGVILKCRQKWIPYTPTDIHETIRFVFE